MSWATKNVKRRNWFIWTLCFAASLMMRCGNQQSGAALTPLAMHYCSSSCQSSGHPLAGRTVWAGQCYFIISLRSTFHLLELIVKWLPKLYITLNRDSRKIDEVRWGRIQNFYHITYQIQYYIVSYAYVHFTDVVDIAHSLQQMCAKSWLLYPF